MDQEDFRKDEEGSLNSNQGIEIPDNGKEQDKKERGYEVAEAILNESEFMFLKLKRDIEDEKEMSEALGSNFIDYTEGFGDKGCGFMGNVICIDEKFFDRHNLGEKFDEEFYIKKGLEKMEFNASDIAIHLAPPRAKEFINKDTERLTQELSDKIREHPRDEGRIVKQFLEHGGHFSYYFHNHELMVVIYQPFSIDYNHPLAEHLRKYREEHVRAFRTVQSVYQELSPHGSKLF